MKNGSKIKFEVSRVDIANMVLTRALFKLKSDGIINIEGKDLIILD